MTEGPHIVVVDDDSAILTLLVATMKAGLGARVTAFASGEAALRGWDGLPEVALLITDYSMPGLTGVELAEVIRGRSPRLPIVVLSAVDEGGGAPGVVTQWLTKPCPPRVLLPLVRQLLGLSETPARAAATASPEASRAAPRLAELKETYRAHLREVLGRLETLVAAAEGLAGERALRDELHQLAGTAGSYGFREVMEAAVALRGAIIGRGPREDSVRALGRALEEATASNPSSAPEPSDA